MDWCPICNQLDSHILNTKKHQFKIKITPINFAKLDYYEVVIIFNFLSGIFQKK